MTMDTDGADNGDMHDQVVDEKMRESSDRGSDVEKKRGDEKRRRSRSRSRDRKERKRSSSRDRKRSRSRDRKRSRSRDRRRSRSRDRGDRDKRRRSRSRDRRRSRSPRRDRDRRDRSRERRRSPDRRRSRSPRRSPPFTRGGGRLPGPERRDVMPFTARKSPPKNAKMDMTSEERDQRTLFILQIARQTRPRDLEEFFSAVGNVRDVRIITDSRTGRSKGIAYVEFWEEESVPLGLALTGQKLLGAPLIIQRTCAERNRAANAIPANVIGLGPTKEMGNALLSVSSLHPDIDEDMLAGILDPFGRLEKVEIFKEPSGASKGYAHAMFRHAEDAQKAMEQLNGFELAGRAIRVTYVDDEDPAMKATRGPTMDNIAEEKAGISLGQGGRAQLMAKLAQSAGVQMPTAVAAAEPEIPAIATQCFMLSNMFDPTKENEPGWADDVKEDVIEECSKNGGALHVYVDQASPQGNVYVKCPNVSVAFKSVNSLHGRWFSGKVITANYVPAQSYHELFPDARHATVPIVPASQRMAPPPPAPIPPPPGGFMPYSY